MTPVDDDGKPADVADGSVESAHEPMAKVRPGAPSAAPLARARVLGALFGDQRTVGSFGRFHVVKRLGAGGMGVVYEAYDPDLARGVALKLVNVAAKDRETALAEAKALARLSHPNVVPIYDVGLERDRVYLVMELVRGNTLRLWPEGRTLREILDMYQQAGSALVAAHGAGLVHRDFKPENAIVGADGRVRVVDFGLACEADEPARATSEPRRVAGTPRFMAPEIKAGTAITPAADQYSFCVALAEALALARGPTPRRIAAVLERGRAADPATRFATMGDLLRALARDPARTRRRIFIIAGLAASVGAIAFFAGRQTLSEAPDACADGIARLEAAWPPAARSTALARLATLGAYGQTLRPTLEPRLDGYITRWGNTYHTACLAHRRGPESDTMADRRMACLDEGRHDLAEAGKLITTADASSLVQLPRAVQSMRDPGSCLDRAFDSDIEPPPSGLLPQISLWQVRIQIWQARFEVGAGRYDQALATASAAVVDARSLGYQPLLAEALLLEGQALLKLPERSAAVPILTEAFQAANRSRARALAIEAWARRAFALGTSIGPDGAAAGLDFVESEATGTASAAFALALLYNNLGTWELSKNDRAAARNYFERALRVQQDNDLGELELVNIRVNLGMFTEDRHRGDELIAQAVAELTDRLGANHPDTLIPREQRGFATIDDLGQAEAFLTPVCRAYELHATLVADAARCWTEVGLLRLDLDQHDGALEAMTRAADRSANAQEAAAYRTLLRSDPHAAVQQLAAAVAAKPPKPGEPIWKGLSRAQLTLGLGRALRKIGDLRGAREALQRTIADLEPYVRTNPGARFERYLGRAQVELAFTLLSMGASPAECAAAAKAGAAWLQHVGGPSSAITLLRSCTG